MLSIVFGLIAICLGFWGLVKYWWYMVDLLVAVLPLVLIFSGIVALIAGIRNTGIKTSFRDKSEPKESDEAAPQTRKKDE
ncbi:MAG TPA: hypothetical protein HPP76_08840 [Desulfuromonadales bacterium]|nr:hypothetical protein [Desulfuromonadales bacterium]